MAFSEGPTTIYGRLYDELSRGFFSALFLSLGYGFGATVFAMLPAVVPKKVSWPWYGYTIVFAAPLLYPFFLLAAAKHSSRRLPFLMATTAIGAAGGIWASWAHDPLRNLAVLGALGSMMLGAGIVAVLFERNMHGKNALYRSYEATDDVD